MKQIDMIYIIRDFINRVLAEVYDITDNGLITEVFESGSLERSVWIKTRWDVLSPEPGSTKEHSLKTSIALVYVVLSESEGYISIYKYPAANIEPLNDIFSKLFAYDISYINGSTIETPDVWEKIFPLLEYTTDELKLYFRML